MVPKAQGAYFAQFCELQLTIFVHMNSTRDFKQVACQCCNVAQRLIREAPENLQSRRNMTRNLQVFLNHWKTFYPGCRTIEDDYIKDWSLLAFKTLR